MSVEMSAKAIEERLRAASAAVDLRPQRRLFAKVDMSAEGIARRIRAASEMLALCLALGSGAESRRP